MIQKKICINKSIVISAGALILMYGGCKKMEIEISNSPNVVPVEIGPINLEVTRTLTDKSLYASGDVIKLGEITITNNSIEDVKIDSMWIEVGATNSSDNIIKKIPLSDYHFIGGNESFTIPLAKVSINTTDLLSKAYLVHLGIQLSSEDSSKELSQKIRPYLTFFRISGNDDKLKYQILTEQYNGLPIYKLYGGLSAEYAVQKSAASINRGISHSWENINPPIQSSPDFLLQSVNETVTFYNRCFGANRKIKTVILSTGITPISYISRVMDAPVLPLHFLVGAHTIKEIQTILDYSIERETLAYATYGHDYSLSTSKGVAWIKLLDLPAAYQRFLIDHQVEEIVFFGATASGGGEKAARKVKNGVEHRKPGSIYLMYFAGSQAEGYLSQVIQDFDTEQLGPIIYISDWESGIIDEQIIAMTGKAKSSTMVGTTSLITSSVDDIHLWNLATYAMIRFYKNNNIIPTGVSLNPYLAGHPFYESYTGLVPFAYFNGSGIPLSAHMGRINGMLSEAFEESFPEINLKDLEFIANTGTRSDLFIALNEEGYTRTSTLANQDIWNLSDGINTPSEVRANDLIARSSASQWNEWADDINYLLISDFKKLALIYPEIIVEDL